MAINTRFGYEGASEVNINLGNAKASSRDAQRDESNHQDWAGALGKGLLDVGNAALTIKKINKTQQDAEDKVDVLQASSDVTSIMMDEGFIGASNVQKQEMLDSYKNNMVDMSDAYQRTAIGKMSSEYVRVSKGAIDEYRDSKYNSFKEGVDNYLDTPIQTAGDTLEEGMVDTTRRQQGKGPKDYIEEFKKEEPWADTKVLNRLVKAQLYEDGIVDILRAESNVELQKAITDFKIDSKPYNTPVFMNSTEKEAENFNNALRSSYNNAVKERRDDFKKQDQTLIASVNKSHTSSTVLGANPDMILDKYESAYPNPITRNSVLQESRKAYKANAVRVNWNTKYDTIDTRTFQDKTVPKEMKEEWGKMVTADASNTFIAEAFPETIQILRNNEGYTTDWGSNVYASFNQAEDTKTITAIVDRISNMSAVPGGASTLRQAITDDKYTEMIAVQGLASSVFIDDYRKAKEYYQQQSESPVANKISKDLLQDMEKHKEALGTHYSSYYSTIQTLNNVNPKVAAAQESKVRNYFINQSTQFKSSIYEYKITEDTSMGNDPFVGLDEDQGFKDVFLNKVMEQTDGVTGIKYLPGGRLQIVDELGSLGTIYNVSAIINSELEQQRLEGRLTPKGKPAGEIIVSTGINIVSGLGSGLGRLFGRGFGSMWDSGAKTLKPLTDWQDEWMRNELEEGSKK